MKRPTTTAELNIVYNLLTGEEITYVGNTQLEKVISAYAQKKGDWNTWNYTALYSQFVKWGVNSVTCGDWCTFRNPQDKDDNLEKPCGILIVADKIKVPSPAAD